MFMMMGLRRSRSMGVQEDEKDCGEVAAWVDTDGKRKEGPRFDVHVEFRREVSTKKGESQVFRRVFRTETDRSEWPENKGIPKE